MCRLEGCLAVNSDGKSGGLALLWRESVTVDVQNHSNYHIDSLVSTQDADPNSKHLSWDMLRRVKRTVKEEWIVGSDFNAILNNAEKDGGRRKSRRSMDEFRDILIELALIDDMIVNFPFINTRVVRQSKFDYEVILLNTIGNKLEEEMCNHSLRFKDIIKRIWDDKNSDMLSRMDRVHKELGPWQYIRYKRIKIEINSLEKKIGKIMDGPISVGSSYLLKNSRDQLGQWYMRKRNT
ncbi:hypothetical protein Golax_000839, partial [Gossypium laxum]|nr:hypothetical protein [Gossypium laxum]